MMRRIIALALLLPLLGAAEGCPAEQSKNGAPSEAPAPPPAAAAAPPPGGFPQAVRPGPQADPNACSAGGERAIQLEAYWYATSDTPPGKIWWSRNGVVTIVPRNLLRSERRPGGHPVLFAGVWNTLVTAKCHDILVVQLEDLPRGYGTGCAIIDLGDGPFKTGEKSCSVTYTVV